MHWNATTVENMRRVFTEGFSARDIAEPLLSVDATTPAEEVGHWMDRRGLQVAGVRRDGLVVGYVERQDLVAGTCGEVTRGIESPITETTALAEVVLRLSERIIAKHLELRSLTRFESRRQVEQAMKMLESLRNNLAHSQDIITCDWEIIVGLSRDLDRVVDGTEEARQALGSTDH